MEIVDLEEKYNTLYFMCLEDWSDEMNEAGSHKSSWFQKMKDKGLGVKLALNDEGNVVGMIQYVPIEYSFAQGSELYYINCIWVHGYEEGVGNYQKQGIEVLEDKIGRGKYDWDVKLKLSDGRIITVDEKVRTREWGDFLVEIIQDLKTGNIGWLYKKKDFYFYASWDNEDNIEPSSFYIIDAHRLVDFIVDNWDKLQKQKISKKGYGVTLNVVVLWEDLKHLGISRLSIPELI